jgi:hypothetical protein
MPVLVPHPLVDVFCPTGLSYTGSNKAISLHALIVIPFYLCLAKWEPLWLSRKLRGKKMKNKKDVGKTFKLKLYHMHQDGQANWL